MCNKWLAIKPLNSADRLIKIKDLVHTPQKTHLIFISKTGSLMLLREIIIVYSENHTKIPVGKFEGFNVKSGGMYI